ncbi:MAG TPA: 4'-phosphopantetheinyl transferase superfamily protein, partial [Prochlorococcaceae cyanobacterium AMR_MDS_5431]|nr:4'-phosphopantetheinyl transferase superfamily protein [Prochlorococcaceae cyanobacterium AMR_MDS_5431]
MENTDNSNSSYTIMWLRQWNNDKVRVGHGTCTYSCHTVINPLQFQEIELSEREICWSEKLPKRISNRYRYSRHLIRQLLAPILNCAPKQVPLYSPPGKRPYLSENSGYISLSHSGNGILVGWSLYPIGVDLENCSRFLDAQKIQKRFFPLQEQKMLRNLQGEALRKAVLRSWVCKEAAIKLEGKSLSMELMNWCLDTQSGELKQLTSGLTPKCLITERRGWLCA